jgi:DNA primase
VRSIKFLFLPAEHDPDSYVREFGQEAFAQQIKQAMPLSRFLIEAASADCDLQSAEGRARLSSQARPLWQLLPEGALKQQLLAELAQLIQLETAGLEKLWAQQTASEQRFAPAGRGPTAASMPPHTGADFGLAGPHGQDKAHHFEPHYGSPPGWTGDSALANAAPAYGSAYNSGANPWPSKNPNWTPGSKFGKGKFKREAVPEYTGPRTVPASRADHAARLLLGNMALWETLAGEDHALLCALPAPHGSLFAWLESQFHEHGALGGSALQAEMQGQAFADEARRWMAQDHLGMTPGSEDATPPDPLEARQELRRLLHLLMIDRLKQLETEALVQASSGQDPEAQQRWRSLHERRKALMAAEAARMSADA